MSTVTPDAPAKADPTPWPPPAPAAATACPKCGAAAGCAAAPQRCGGCGKRFTLHAGALLDPSVQAVEPDPQAKRVKVRAAGWLLYHAGILEPDSIQEGTLDPVIGRLPVNSTAIAYRHVYSIAFWRTLDVAPVILVSLATLISALFLIGAFAEPGVWVIGVPFLLLTTWGAVRVFGVRRWHARVVGLKGTVITVRFDKPWWNRRRFHRELLRRCGAPFSPMP